MGVPASSCGRSDEPLQTTTTLATTSRSTHRSPTMSDNTPHPEPGRPAPPALPAERSVAYAVCSSRHHGGNVHGVAAVHGVLLPMRVEGRPCHVRTPRIATGCSMMNWRAIPKGHPSLRVGQWLCPGNSTVVQDAHSLGQRRRVSRRGFSGAHLHSLNQEPESRCCLPNRHRLHISDKLTHRRADHPRRDRSSWRVVPHRQ